MRSYLIDRIRSVLLIAAIASLSIALSPAPAVAVDPSFTFKGGGWGHGIGMSQYGAQGYAKKGWKYSSILTHYYQGTKLVTKPTVKVRVNIEDGGASRTQWKIHAGGNDRAGRGAGVRPHRPPDAQRDQLVLDHHRQRQHAGTRRLLRRAGQGAQDLLGRVLRHCRRAGSDAQLERTVQPRGRPLARHDPLQTAEHDLEHDARDQLRRPRGVPLRCRAAREPVVVARPRRSRPRRSRRAPTPTKTAWSDGSSTAPRSRRSTTATRDPGHAHEAASTNAAVDATKGKLVWYGSETEPVKTYFSSSLGRTHRQHRRRLDQRIAQALLQGRRRRRRGQPVLHVDVVLLLRQDRRRQDPRARCRPRRRPRVLCRRPRRGHRNRDRAGRLGLHASRARHVVQRQHLPAHRGDPAVGACGCVRRSSP